MAEESGSRWSQAVSSSGYDTDTGQQTETSQDARNMAMLCHILGAVGFFGPLVIWLIERDKHRFVAEHGRQAMNYQISLLIYSAVSAGLCVLGIGFILLWLLSLAHLVLILVGALRASRGKTWCYPIALPILK